MKKQKNRNYYRGFALGSLGLLFFLGAGAVILPELKNTSSALTCENGLVVNNAGTNMSLGDVCAQKNAGVSVGLGEVLQATVDVATANFGNLTSGTLSTRDVTVTVDTNAAKGYNIQLNGVKTVTAATSAASNDLVGNATPYPTISTFASGASVADRTPSTFAAGKWGYMVTTAGVGSSGNVPADTVYNAIPDAGATSSAKTARSFAWNDGSLTKVTTFRFGIKPAANQATGTYEGQVLFTITPNT